MKYIILSSGKKSVVDNQDYKFLSQWHWWFNGKYALREERYGKRSENKRKKYYMHRIIMKVKRGDEIDHINGDKLDNRRGNLRICTHRQNAHNKSIQKNNTSGHKGVYFNKMAKKWQAYITVNMKVKYLGLFEDKEEAAMVYNRMAQKHFGDFAKLNML